MISRGALSKRSLRQQIFVNMRTDIAEVAPLGLDERLQLGNECLGIEHFRRSRLDRCRQEVHVGLESGLGPRRPAAGVDKHATTREPDRLIRSAGEIAMVPDPEISSLLW